MLCLVSTNRINKLPERFILQEQINHTDRKLRLTEHLQYVHNGIQPPTCEYCCKTFVRKEDLTRHVELHVGERNFGCSICKKTVRV